jgi:hypothetical protein
VLFKHSSGERQRPEPGSLSEAELVAKAADPASGWRRVDDDQTTTTEDGVTRLVKHRPAPGRRSRPAVAPGEGSAPEEGTDNG